MLDHVVDLTTLAPDEARATLFDAMFEHLVARSPVIHLGAAQAEPLLDFGKQVESGRQPREASLGNRRLLEGISWEKPHHPTCVPIARNVMRFFMIIEAFLECADTEVLPTVLLLQALHAVEDDPCLARLRTCEESLYLGVTTHGVRQLNLRGELDVTTPDRWIGYNDIMHAELMDWPS